MDRQKNEQNYIFGKNAVSEAILSGKPIQKIYFCYGTDNKLLLLAKKNKIICTTFDKRKFGELEKKHCPNGVKSQGVIALLHIIETLDINDFINNLIDKNLDNKYHSVVGILDGILDPQNLGAIARSAECAGVSGIIISGFNSSPVTPAAIKSSAGALNYLPIVVVHNLILAIEKLKKAGFWIIGTDMSGECQYDNNIYDRPVVVIIGNEGKGISPSLKKHCDYLVNIPMFGKINSLNASVTAGVLFFEIVRQCRLK